MGLVQDNALLHVFFISAILHLLIHNGLRRIGCLFNLRHDCTSQVQPGFLIGGGGQTIHHMH